jgi:hypothetical protein
MMYVSRLFVVVQILLAPWFKVVLRNVRGRLIGFIPSMVGRAESLSRIVCKPRSLLTNEVVTQGAAFVI